MNQIFVFANIPVLLQRRNHHILHHLSYLIITLLVLHHIQLHFLLLAYNLLLFDLEGQGTLFLGLISTKLLTLCQTKLLY